MVMMASRRVVVAVRPRLLADVLIRSLAAEDIDVTLYVEDARIEVRGQRYDIAIVSGSLPAPLHVDVVVRLPEDAGAAGTGTVETCSGTRAFHFTGPSDLVDLIARLSSEA